MSAVGVTIAAAATGRPALAEGSPDVDSVLEYLPASAATDRMSVEFLDVEGKLEADLPHGPHLPRPPLGIDPEEAGAIASVIDHEDGYTERLTVLLGEFEPDGESEERETDDGTGYELYEGENRHACHDDESLYVAVADDVTIVGSEERIEDAFAAAAGEKETLLEAETRIEDGLEAFEDADRRAVALLEEHHLTRDVDGFDDEDIDYLAHGAEVVDSDTMELHHGIAFEDEGAITDELLEELEEESVYVPVADEPTVEVDGAFVTVTAVRDLAAERAVAEHDSPGHLRARARELDADDDYLEIEVGRGDPTPVEDLTLELDGEEYDPEIWADGAEEIAEGDSLLIEVEEVEPNLRIRLTHDHEMGSSGSGTTLLNHFRFEFAYDYDEKELEVIYRDEFPLDGDRLHLAAFDADARRFGPTRDEPEPRIAERPWDGELEEGATATLEGVEPGDRIVVGWDGTSPRDALGHYHVRPPGSASFEYDADEGTVTVELDPDGERPAAEYDLRVDDEPASTTWTDEYDVVEDGASIELPDVEVGSRVAVVWGDDELRIGSYRARPTVDLELRADEAELEHVGGDELPAGSLELRTWGEDGEETVDLDGEIDGEFEEGDVVEVPEDTVEAMLHYEGDHWIGSAWDRR